MPKHLHDLDTTIDSVQRWLQGRGLAYLFWCPLLLIGIVSYLIGVVLEGLGLCLRLLWQALLSLVA